MHDRSLHWRRPSSRKPLAVARAHAGCLQLDARPRPRRGGVRRVPLGHRGLGAMAPENTLASIRTGAAPGGGLRRERHHATPRTASSSITHDLSLERTTGCRAGLPRPHQPPGRGLHPRRDQAPRRGVVVRLRVRRSADPHPARVGRGRSGRSRRHAPRGRGPVAPSPGSRSTSTRSSARSRPSSRPCARATSSCRRGDEPWLRAYHHARPGRAGRAALLHPPHRRAARCPRAPGSSGEPGAGQHRPGHRRPHPRAVA